jgi:AcrR family transcriptional regulator
VAAVAVPKPSARREELLEGAYAYVLRHGLTGLSLRPLATDIGSSPRVLLFLFGSKDELVRALLARARADELAMVADLRRRTSGEGGDAFVDLSDVATQVWAWLADPVHRPVLTLWVEGYARSLVEPDGPWSGFARATVDDWLDVLATAQPVEERHTTEGEVRRTLVLSVLRGALLDLLATGDVVRTTAAVHRQIDGLRAG